ncbi:MAG: penicillin-binding transpeptidase domain-containing protein [Legionellales bacterium]|jgi:cell division protein FtsI (penicillin-binding protein 3)
MKDKKDFTWRYSAVLILMAIGIIILGIRLVDLHIFNHDFLTKQGDMRTVRTVNLPAHRGMILDRNGEPLAISTPVDSIWINPKEYFIEPQDITPMTELLDMNVSDFAKRLDASRKKEFLYVKRQLNPEIAHSVLALEIPGVYTQREYRRFYPLGEVTAQLIGVTNIDGTGQEGIELAYDEALSGQDGKKRVLRDRLGRVIENIELIQTNQDGQHLYLSIDKRIQYLAYRELKSAITKHQAKAGMVIAIDVNTSEVLAMVNYPSFNPNGLLRPQAGMRNRAVADTFEPGSTMKPLAMAAILETGEVDFDTIVDTSPGHMKVHRNVVKDLHNYGPLSLTMVLRHSSNVGIAKLLLPLPREDINQIWQRLGLTQITQSGFPGEQAGRITMSPNLDSFSYATQAFGYGLSVTGIQLAQAYATLANEGEQHPVSLLRINAPIRTEKVLDKEVAIAVSQMLVLNAEDQGTGRYAQIPGYKVSGKTGTTRKINETGGYADNRHVALFAGFAPATNPQIAMIVLIDEPTQGEYYGGLVAAPVFSKIMGGSLRLLNVPPDDLSPNG